MNVEHLKQSCNRLPQLFAIEAPTSFIIEEMSILTAEAFALLKETRSQELRKEVDIRRDLKETQRGQNDAS